MQQMSLKSDKEGFMSTRRAVQYILGYVIGGFVVLILIPLGLWKASHSFDRLTGGIQMIPFAGLRIAIAVVMFFFGLLFGVWSNVALNMVGQGGPLEVAGMEVSPKTRNLVVTGPYRYTRNPMLFGACVFYYGIALYLNSVIAAALVTLFMIILLIFIKLTEEPRLLKDFGNNYEEYRQRVSLFVPRFF
jgi:protein-S-isoprenylcysteine O-methyltransferase Ste14